MGGGARPRVVLVHHLERVATHVEEGEHVAGAHAGGQPPVRRAGVAGEHVAAVAERAGEPEAAVVRRGRPGDGAGAEVPPVVGVLEQGVEAGVDGQPALLPGHVAGRVASPLGLDVLDARDEHAGGSRDRPSRFEQQGEVGTPGREHVADRGGIVLEAERGGEVVDGVAVRERLAVRHSEAAAGVEELEPHAGRALDLGDDVERRAHGPAVRRDAGDLRPDVQVQADGAQARVAGDAPERLHGVAAVDAGLAAVGRLEARVRERRHVDVDARRHRRRGAEASGHGPDALDLEEGVGEDGAHPGAHRGRDLALRLGDAVEDDLRRREPGAQRLRQLPAGVDLDAQPGVAQHVEDPEVGARLAGVEDLGRPGAAPGTPRARRRRWRAAAAR